MDKYELLYEWAKRTMNSRKPRKWPQLITSTNLTFSEWKTENWDEIEDYADDLFGINLIKSDEDFGSYGWPDDDPENPFMCVMINLDLPKDRLIEDFRQFLKKHHKGKVGRPEPLILTFGHFEWCEISGQTTLDTLELMLTIYDLRKNTELRLWQIAEKLKMNPSQATKETDTRSELADKKAILSSTVSRYLQWAKTLMGNLERGRFPEYR